MWLIPPTLKKTGTIQGLHPKKGSGYTPPRRGERLQWARTWRVEKKKDDVVHCYGCFTGQFTETLPEIACSSEQHMAVILWSPSCPRHLVCIGTLWKFASWLPLKPLCLNRLAEQLLSEGFVYVESLCEELIPSVERKLVEATSHIYVIFPVSGNFSQHSS